MITKFTVEDWKGSFNVMCCVLGLGSLGLARCYAQAGPVYATIALFVMCIINIYTTSYVSKCMKRAPLYVQTFGDLGEYCAGTFGRYLVVVTQFGSCLMTPIAFLVLGGSQILPNLFKDVWPDAQPNQFIPLMAACLLPIVLIRSLKEGAWVALIGAAGTFFGDGMAVIESMIKTVPYSHTTTAPTVGNVAGVFGTLSLAYGAAVVIPGIQRDLKHPERMPAIIAFSLLVITVIYLLIGVLGYIKFGCIAPSNLLKSMENRGLEIAAQLFFFIHIVIAYAVLLNPALYIFERKLFGFHQKPYSSGEADPKVNHGDSYVAGSTPKEKEKLTQYEKDRKSFLQGQLQDGASYIQGKRSFTASYTGEIDFVEDVENLPFPMRDRIRSYAMRTTVVAGQVAMAMLLQGCFNEFADLIGATGITMSCIIIPIFMYLKMFKKEVKTHERIILYIVVVVSFSLGVFSAYRCLSAIAENIAEFKPFRAPPNHHNASIVNEEFCTAELTKLIN